jgi:hypothetical protein
MKALSALLTTCAVMLPLSASADDAYRELYQKAIAVDAVQTFVDNPLLLGATLFFKNQCNMPLAEYVNDMLIAVSKAEPDQYAAALNANQDPLLLKEVALGACPKLADALADFRPGTDTDHGMTQMKNGKAP